MNVRSLHYVCSGVLGLALIGGTTAAAATGSADESRPGYAAAANNPHISAQVMESLPDMIRDDPDVYISPDITEDTVIVDVNGDLVPGQNAGQAQVAASTCGNGFNAGLAGNYVYSRSNCALWGHDGYYITYRWSYGVFGPNVSMKVKGYLYPGPYAAWQYGGTYNPGSYRIYWGNVLAYPEVGGASVSATSSNRVSWYHSKSS